MANFDVVECGFNIADETINFGTRCLADGTNLHEVATLASLKCSDELVDSSPHINSLIREGRIYFSINSSFRIFKDKQCSDVIFNVTFDHDVDTFCLPQNGSYILVFLRNGSVHLLDSENQFASICSRDIQQGVDEKSLKNFISVLEEPCSLGIQFIVVLRQGHILRITISPDKEDVLSVEDLYKVPFPVEVASLNFPYLLINGRELCIIDLERSETVFDDALDIKSVFPLGYAFVFLNMRGMLNVLYPESLLTVPMYNVDLYGDVLLLSDSKINQLLTVTQRNLEQESFIQLVSYGDLSVIFSVKVTSGVHLIQPESMHDEIMYISQVLSNDHLSELRFHVIYETEPEQKLNRLLRKQLFKEAEEFANNYNLDMNIIRKAKAQLIVDQTECDESDIDKLINLLNTIDDNEFKLKSCIDVESSCTCFGAIRKILRYGCVIEANYGDDEDNLNITGYLSKIIADLMFRFDTYLRIYSENLGIQDWMRFAQCNLTEELISFLSNYQIQEALTIYSRLNNYNVKEIQQILSTLKHIPVDMYQQFLPMFIKITLTNQPSALSLIVDWAHDKVIHMEKHDKAQFPRGAIQFMELVLNFMKDKDVSGIFFQRQRMLHHQSLGNLGAILSALKSLKKLRDECEIMIPLQEFLSNPETVVSTVLSVEISPDVYDMFLRDFLCQFMLDHQLSPNDIFLSEILNLMKYEERYWTHIDSILNCITSIEIKLEAIRTILYSASVPWSDRIKTIAYDGVQYPHHLASEIKRLLEEEPMYVVLKKPPYKIKEKRISNISDLRFAIKRIIYCNEPSMIEDIFNLCITPEYRHEANLLIVRHFIKTRDYDRALSTIDNNTPEEILKCCRELACFAMFHDNELMLEDIKTSYYGLARSIHKRIELHSQDTFESSCIGDTINLLKSGQELYNNFKVNVTCHELKQQGNKEKILRDAYNVALKKYQAGEINVQDIFSRLASSLAIPLGEVIVMVCSNVKNYKIVLKSSELLYEVDRSAKNLCLMAVLLLRYSSNEDVSGYEQGSFFEAPALLPSSIGFGDQLLFDGMKMSQKIVSKAIANAGYNDLLACLEVMNWMHVSFFLTKSEGSPLKKALFDDIYSSMSSIPGYATSSLNTVFNQFCKFLCQFKNPNLRHLTHFYEYEMQNITEDEFCISVITDCLCKEGQHLTAYMLLNTLKRFIENTLDPDTKFLEELDNILRKRCIPKVLQVVVTAPNIDPNLLYNVLLTCTEEDADRFISKSGRIFKRHPNKFSTVAAVGIRLLTHFKKSKGLPILYDIVKAAKWWSKLKESDINYDKFFRSNTIDRFELLIDSGCMSGNLLISYTKDFRLDPQTAYLIYFKRTLCNWKPEYEIEKDVTGRRRLNMKNNEESLRLECIEIAKRIENPATVVQCINSIWSTINFYFHEVFIAMLRILTEICEDAKNETKIQMLLFLKNYHRISKPSQAESEQWYTLFPDTQTVHIFSEFRLPFTCALLDRGIWNIIRPEVNLNTYTIWFMAIDIAMNEFLNKDDICCYVLKEIVSSNVLNDKYDGKWVFYPRHEDMFSQIDECLQHISSLERATSSIYHVMTHTPNGADQVIAAKLCLKYAKMYREEHSGSADVEKAFVKVQKKYYVSSALHILHTYRLAEEKYMSSINNPEGLITALYNDERILDAAETVDFQCPDITKATEDLAQLFDLDIQNIRMILVNHWLMNSQILGGDLNFSMVFSNVSLNCSQLDEACELDNLTRAAYVCSSNNVTYWQNYLYNIGFNKEVAVERSVSCRVRALKVFASITDDSNLSFLAKLSHEELRVYIEKLTIIDNLHKLDISLDLETLDLYNKVDLVNSLMRKSGNPLTTKTVAMICMTYLIYNLKYWEYVINCTMRFHMYIELKIYIQFLMKETCYCKPFYIKAWQKLVDHAFLSVTNLSEEKHMVNILVKNFLMIQSCPVSHWLNYEYVFKRCAQVNRMDFAALVLQYVPNDSRKALIAELTKYPSRLTEESLNKLQKYGVLGISLVKSLLLTKTT